MSKMPYSAAVDAKRRVTRVVGPGIRFEIEDNKAACIAVQAANIAFFEGLKVGEGEPALPFPKPPFDYPMDLMCPKGCGVETVFNERATCGKCGALFVQVVAEWGKEVSDEDSSD